MNIYNIKLKDLLKIWFQPKTILWFILICMICSVRKNFHIYIIVDIGGVVIYFLLIFFLYKLYLSIQKACLKYISTDRREEEEKIKKISLIGVFIYFIMLLIIWSCIE